MISLGSTCTPQSFECGQVGGEGGMRCQCRLGVRHGDDRQVQSDRLVQDAECERVADAGHPFVDRVERGRHHEHGVGSGHALVLAVVVAHRNAGLLGKRIAVEPLRGPWRGDHTHRPTLGREQRYQLADTQRRWRGTDDQIQQTGFSHRTTSARVARARRPGVYAAVPQWSPLQVPCHPHSHCAGRRYRNDSITAGGCVCGNRCHTVVHRRWSRVECRQGR